ncbi:Tryptophan synthase alpha chain [Labilithrix luteola]|uniref:Tryptophan synthase alpha chain n=1 Tax=Labilithrix luteola TaxID=1391654 RepID=A0A0K1PXD3_9BACT|nr:carboxypeptidase-like regulatory domain-containing protein [Labilithrix luteola]AKU98195.1 Tryptophan synthase alpha chain [Labilithrix luteola]
MRFTGRMLAVSVVVSGGLIFACGSSGDDSTFGNGSQTGDEAGTNTQQPGPGPLIGDDASTDPTGTCKPKTCADLGANCGPIGDGCGNVVQCGACSGADETCGGGGTPSVCGKPPCTKLTCADLGANCGAAGDGCGGVIPSCGTCDATKGEICGGGGASKCGLGGGGGDAGDDGGVVCTPKTCTDVGANCGPVSDGCGGLINCGTCDATKGETCGGAGVPSVCGKACKPLTACPAGLNCGPIADGCGGIISCGGACAGADTCGGGGTANVCGTNTTCTGLCPQQTTCAGGGTTSISGTVTSPNGVLPIYGATVYVPNAPVKPFTTGVTCEQCGAATAGVALVTTTTGPDGKFLLPNVPVSSTAPGKTNEIPVVIQLGRWRKQFTVVTSACTNTPVDALKTRLPKNKTEGDIPLTAISTGNVDGLECVFRKIGIEDSEFTNPSGNGRIRLYQDNGAVITKSSGLCSGSGESCSNYGGSCGNRCSGNGTSCKSAGSTCATTCSMSGTTCTAPGTTCGNRCSSNGTSCTTFGASCDSGKGTCGSPGRCTTTDNRCSNIGGTCDGAGTCVAELRCSSNGNRCNASQAPGASCDSGNGTCGVDACVAGGTCTSAGTCNQQAGTPAANTLYNDPNELAKYDMTLFECVGGRQDKSVTQQQNVREYANKGGRVYATHFSYVWLYNTGAAPWNSTASWGADQASWPAATATLDTSFGKGQAFAQWLNIVGGLLSPLPAGAPPWTPAPQITINEARHDVDSPITSPAQRWLYTTTASSPNVSSVQHYTFNTDWTKPADQQCGRVLFSDFHVTTGSNTNNVVFPAECDNNPLTTQEKVLAFMLFDLASCVSTGAPPTTCKAKTCAEQGVECGQAGDGCGNVITCPDCTGGMTCGGGGMPSKCGSPACTKKTCAAGQCGKMGDGCGGTLDCGTCNTGTCGGGGTPNKCGAGACTPGVCPTPAAGSVCGPVADGCGGLITPACACPAGLQCINGKCGTPSCTPRTCAQAGANCGQVADGCGDILNCGTCLSPQTCGGGGLANVCGGGVN